jgi:hypothetical protein
MAASILGLTTLTFGVPTVSGLIVNSTDFTESVNIAEVTDEDGDFVAAALHGKKITGSVSGTSNGPSFSLGATLAVTGAPSGTYYITEKSVSRSADGFEQFTVGLTSWGGI